MDWTRADVLECMTLVLGPVAAFVAVVGVYVLGLSILRDLGRL